MAEKKSASKREPRASTGPRFELNVRWVAVIFAVLTVLFFHEVSVGGRTFVSPDVTAPAGFVRVGEQSLYHDHVYPVWNPFVFLGMPSFASGAYNPLIYPPDWPLALVQKVVPLPEMTWLLLYYFLGGLFAFLLAREWGARPAGALLGAIAFVFQPNLVAVGSHGHGSQLVDSAYLPLMLWLATRWLRRGGWKELAFLALAGGFQFLRGHVQICFYTWLAIGIYALVEVVAAVRQPERLVPRLARAAGLGVAAALAFGLAGFYNLPLKDYAQYSIRGSSAGGGAGLAYATGWSLAPYELPSMVLPNWVGFGDATYWGAMPFTNYPNAYLGVIAVLLALLAFLPRRDAPAAAGALGSPRVFALVLAAFSLMIAFGSHFPLYGFLYAHLPQFNKFRIPVMVIVLFQLATALAMAWGWSAVLEQGARAKDARAKGGGLERVLLIVGGALALMLALGLAGGGPLRGFYLTLATTLKPGFSPEAASAAFAMFAGDLTRVALLGLAGVAAAWLTLRGRMTATLGTLAVLALLLVDLWPVSGHVMRPVIGEVAQRNLDIGRDDVVDFLEKAGPVGSFRVFQPQDFMSNRLAGFAVSTLGGNHAAKPRLFQDLMDGGDLNDPRIWRLLNVKYIVLGQPPEQLPEYLQRVHTGSATVLENLLALPRVTLIGDYGVVPDTGRVALDSIRAGTHDPGTFTWLTKAPGVSLGPVEGGHAQITRYGLHAVDIDVDTPGPALVRLADEWYPDWRATVDGRPVEVLRADHLLRAVVVPAGHHAVRFQFHSAAIRRGMIVSLASLGVILALILVDWLQRRGAGPRAAATAPEVPTRG